MSAEEQFTISVKWLNIWMILSVLFTPIFVVLLANMINPVGAVVAGIIKLLLDAVWYLWYRGSLEREL